MDAEMLRSRLLDIRRRVVNRLDHNAQILVRDIWHVRDKTRLVAELTQLDFFLSHSNDGLCDNRAQLEQYIERMNGAYK